MPTKEPMRSTDQAVARRSEAQPEQIGAYEQPAALTTQGMPSVLVPGQALQLQRAIGNRAVGRMLHAGTIHSKRSIQRELTDEKDQELFYTWADEALAKAGAAKSAIIAYCIEMAHSLEEAQKLAVSLLDQPQLVEQSFKETSGALDKHKKKKESVVKSLESSLKRKQQQKGDTSELVTKIKEIQTELLLLDQGTPGLPEAVASLADVLIETFPPGTCLYIMLGNSPAPLMAYLSLRRKNFPKLAMVNIPLGGLSSPNDISKSSEPTEKRKEYAEATGKASGKINKYLHYFLAPYLKSGRKFVLIDYASTGLSSVVMADLVQRYLKEMESPHDVSLFAFAEEPPKEKSLLMTSGYEAAVASPLGEAEKLFTKLTMDKFYKNTLSLLQYKSLDITELLEASDPIALLHKKATPGHYLRLLMELEKGLKKL